jgi:hypothetical protein
MFGPGVTVDHLLSMVRSARPTYVMLGASKYTQLAHFAESYNSAESEYKPAHLDSIMFIAPMGSAVSAAHFMPMKNLFPNLKVRCS